MNEIETLRASLVCDANGVLTWRVSLGGRATAGDKAGSVSDEGYLRVRLNGKRYRAHRVVWALHHGAWPAGEIDHIDGCRINNRIENLRDVSNSVNHQNLKRANRNNRSGSSVPGVHFSKAAQKFLARPVLNGKKINVGRFDTLSAAEAAVLNFRREHFIGNTL